MGSSVSEDVSTATQVAGPPVWARPLSMPYWWLSLVVVSMLDLTLTHLVLSIGGLEVNPLARQVIDLADFHGLIVFKFGLMTGVVLMAEFIALHAPPTARKLALAAVVISAFPVVWSVLMLAELFMKGQGAS